MLGPVLHFSVQDKHGRVSPANHQKDNTWIKISDLQREIKSWDSSGWRRESLWRCHQCA